MIKRDGMEIKGFRNKNASLARDILDICKTGEYTSANGVIVDISTALAKAKAGTIFYEDLIDQTEITPIVPTLEVINETTTQAATRLLAAGKENLVALNFASARCPGGGFLAGAQAQEEDLCRASALYPCIKNKPMYYNANILCDDTYYTDGIIYSPEVPFFRNDHSMFLEEPYLLSIITAPAPNVSAINLTIDSQEKQMATLYFRMVKILQIAHKHGHKNLILGAWGCGAFGNNPTIVALQFLQALETVPAFEHVSFPVYDTREGAVLFETFKQVVVK